MSMHKIPLTDLERRGLAKHLLLSTKPSQLSDAFRLGVRWAIENTPTSKSFEQRLSEFVNYVIDNDLSNTLEAAMHQFLEEQQ